MWWKFDLGEVAGWKYWSSEIKTEVRFGAPLLGGTGTDLISQGGVRPRPEHQVEMFYNFHISPWLRLTGDLQIIRPTRRIAERAIVPGARLEMRF
jgi:porin